MDDRLTEICQWLSTIRETWPSAHPTVSELVGIATEARRERDDAKEHAARLERYYTGEHQAGVNAAMERMAADATKAEQERDTALASLAEVDRLTADRDAMMDAFTEAFGKQDGAYLDQIAAVRRERDNAHADLSALRIEHEAVRGLLAHTRRDRDAVREEAIQAVKDNISLRCSVDILDGTVAGLKVQRDEARLERDAHLNRIDADRSTIAELREYTARLEARIAELEARHTYADGVREAIAAVYGSALYHKATAGRDRDGARMVAAILALLESKP